MATKIKHGKTEVNSWHDLARNHLAFFPVAVSNNQLPAHIALIAGKVQRAIESPIVDKNRLLIISVPPRHGKTELISKHLPAWYLGRYPRNRIILTSYGAQLAEDNSSRAKDIFGEWFHLWPGVLPSKSKWKKASWETNQGGGVIAAGVGGPCTGYGAECVDGNTLVCTDNGEKKIKNLQIGDMVLSLDKELCYNKILAIKESKTNEIYEITIGRSKVRATGNHRFFILGKGYIKAEDLQTEDKTVTVKQGMPEVWEGEKWKRSSLQAMFRRNEKSGNSICVRLLREGFSEKGLRCQEGKKEREQGCLLFRRMFKKSSCNKKSSKMPHVRESCPKKDDAILLRSMQAIKEKTSSKKMFKMWKRVSAPFLSHNSLFKRMCKHNPFFKNDRGREFSLQRRSLQAETFLRNEKNHYRKRWPRMQYLWNKKWHIGSSCKQENIRQSARKFNNYVQQLPYNTSQIKTESISSIKKISTTEHTVYDIQVEKAGNFFANKILVHNCFIIDDYCKGHEEAESPIIREKIWNWWQSVSVTRLHPGAVVIILACMTGDTKVTIEDGSWKYLKDIEIGDRILTYKEGRVVSRRILNKKEQGVDEIHEIKTSNNTVKANARHPFLVQRDNGNKEWVRVYDLRAGDRLVCIGENNTFHNNTLSNDELWLLGYMYGDGWLTIRDAKNYDKQRDKYYPRRSIVTCVAKKNKHDRNEKIVKLFKEIFNISIKETKYGYYRTEKQVAGKWFLNHGLMGNSHTKRLPRFIFSETLENRMEFLDGFLNSDGWKIEKKNHTGYGIKLCNKELINDLRQLARSCGYKPSNIYHSISVNKPPHSKSEILSDAYTFSFSDKRIHDEFATAKIRKIDKAGSEIVYDIQVEDSECFIADGLVSHNTRWHDDDLIGRLLKQYEEDGAEEFPFILETINLPAIAEPQDLMSRQPGAALWPSRYNEKRLEHAKKAVGPYWWSALFQGSPTDRGGTLFKSANFRYYEFDALRAEYVCHRKDKEPIRIKKTDLVRHVYVDPAIEVKKVNDPTGMLAWGYSRKYRVWLLLDRINDRIEHTEIMEKIKAFAWKNQCILIGIENEKLGKVLVKQSFGNDRVNGQAIPFREISTNGLDKYTRAVPMANYIENERVFFLRGVHWLSDYESYLTKFPNADHDEDVDCTSMAENMESKISLAEVLAGR